MQVKESKTNWHFRISIVKSILRIVAGIALCNGLLIPSGAFFVVAEVLGIIEEL
jgi:hypothetical protein